MVAPFHTRGTSSQWAAADDVLLDGEIGLERKPNGKTALRFGDGVSEPAELYRLDPDEFVLNSGRFFNVEDYGAVAGGDPAANSIALQECIDDAVSGRGWVVAPGRSASYTYDTPLDTSGNSWGIWGMGKDATKFAFVGEGPAFTHDDTANWTRRVFKHFTIDVRGATAGAICLDLIDVGRSVYQDLRFRATTPGGGTCVRITGIGADRARSSYYNDFYSCEFSASTACLEFIGSANRNHFFGGIFDGAGKFIHCEQGGGGFNCGTNTFIGICVATSNVNLLELGMATGSTSSLSNWQFISCVFEPEFEGAGFVLHPNVVRSLFLGGSMPANTPVTTDPASVNTIMMPPYHMLFGATGKTGWQMPSVSANTGITLGGDTNLYRSAADTLKTDDKFRVGGDVIVGDGATSSITLSGASFSASGSNANVNLNLNAKGTGQVRINTLGLATGGTQIEASGGKFAVRGSAPVVTPAVTGSRGGNAALASLLTQLALQGIITDSTTA